MFLSAFISFGLKLGINFKRIERSRGFNPYKLNYYQVIKKRGEKIGLIIN
tara:strand:+ start:1036 stop:1185 length:150 start_codon:yes stop_codon:yes gene_type:complete